MRTEHWCKNLEGRDYLGNVRRLKFRMCGAVPSPTHLFTARCLIERKDIFTFILYVRYQWAGFTWLSVGSTDGLLWTR